MRATTSLTIQPVFKQLIDAALRSASIGEPYDRYIQSVLSEPLWEPGSPGRSRLPWRLAAEAKNGDTAWTHALNQRGLYLFGSEARVPLYWGMTAKQTLWKRVNDRYTSLGSKSSMFPIASRYESALVSNGFAGFPSDFVREFVPRQRLMRFLELAADFAPHGINGIWLTVIPLLPDDDVPALESLMIRAGNEWNVSHGLPSLLNTRHP